MAIILATANATPVPTHSNAKPRRHTTDEKVHLVNADELRYDQYKNPGAQILVGNVIITHTGMRLTCDSAVVYEASNSFMAVGRVKMVQGDTLSLTGDSLYYSGDSQIAEVRRNVVMTHRKTKLYTDNLNYDRVEKKGYFFEGGRMIDGDNDLTSDWGEYHTDTRLATFNDRVELRNPEFRLVTDTLNYNTTTKWSELVGPSNLFSGNSRIYTESGFYNTTIKQARLYERPQLFNKGSKLVGDSLHYDKVSGLAEAFGNIVYRDTVNRNILLGEYGFYNELTGESMATGHALAKDYSQSLTDTLFVHADTLRTFTFNMDTDSVYRRLHGYYHVRAFRSDIQAVSDSLSGCTQDSTLTLYKDPIVWSDNRQILGESITAYLNDSTVDSVYVDHQALLVERLDSTLYNQVAGRQMRAYYIGKRMHENVVDGNGTVIYYPYEQDSTILYQVYMQAAWLRVLYDDKGQLDSIKGPAADGLMYPLGLAPKEHTFLPNFAWFDYIRPIDKYDLFEWRPKKTGSELKWQPRRKAPLQYLKPQPGQENTQESPSDTPKDEAPAPDNTLTTKEDTPNE